MAEEDIGQVAELERRAFSQPWSEEGIRHYLTSGLTLFVVAKNGPQVAGYAAVMCILDEGNLVSIVVEESCRQMGIAGELLDILYEELKKEQVTSLHLEVRKSNEPAIRLYERDGFELVGERKGFYDRPKEDALLYRKLL